MLQLNFAWVLKMRDMTKEEAREIFERAKLEVSSLEVVMNRTSTDQEVRDGVLHKLLKMFYESTGKHDPVFLKEGESHEQAIAKFLRDIPGSYDPYKDIEDVIEVAMEQRRRWQQ
jgi:hypothetical protein